MASKKVVSRSYYKDSDSSGEYDPKLKFSNDKLKYLQFSPKNLKSQSPKRKSHKSDKKTSPKSKKLYKDDLARQYFSKGSNQKTVNPRKNLTPLSSNLPRKKQEEDQSLKAKMSNLQKSIVAQEKLLQDIQQKMKNERSEIVSPSDYTSKKIQNERIEDEKSILKRTSIGKSDQQNGTKKYDSGKKHDNEYMNYREKYNDSEEESSEDEKSYIDLRKSQKNYFSANVPDGAAKRERKRDLLEEELDKKGEETVHQKRKVNEMKSVMKDITRKYEIEIDNLKHEINVLSEKNFKMKNNALSTKDQKRIEELYAKRIKDLEEAVRLKEREAAEKEGYYKSQLEDVKIKMEELQREVRKIGDYEDKVQELTQQLQLKDKEMEIIKKYYSDKLQAKTDDQIKQKKEWTNTNNDLLLEIRNLRREVDLLEYENKKLGGNSSALKQREELNYVSSRRVNHDI